MSGSPHSSFEEIHREILNRSFIDLAKYLVDLKNRGLSVKLIRKALVKSIYILNDKITAENLIDYIKFLLFLERKEIIPNRIEFFRASLPAFIEAMCKNSDVFLKTIDILLENNLLPELKLIMDMIEHSDSLPVTRADEIIYILRTMFGSLMVSHYYLYEEKKRIRISFIPITYATNYEAQIIVELVENSIIERFLEHKHLLRILPRFAPRELGHILSYYYAFYLINNKAPSAAKKAVNLMKRLKISTNETYIQDLFDGVWEGMKFFRVVAVRKAEKIRSFISKIKNRTAKPEEAWKYFESCLKMLGFLQLYQVLSHLFIAIILQLVDYIGFREAYRLIKLKAPVIFDEIFEFCYDTLLESLQLALRTLKKVYLSPSGFIPDLIKMWQNTLRKYGNIFVDYASSLDDTDLIEYLNLGHRLSKIFIPAMKSIPSLSKKRLFERIMRIQDEYFERFVFALNDAFVEFMNLLKINYKYYKQMRDKIMEFVEQKAERPQKFIDYVYSLRRQDIETLLGIFTGIKETSKIICDCLEKMTPSEFFDVMFNKLILGEANFYEFLAINCVWSQFKEKYRSLTINDMVSILDKFKGKMHNRLIGVLLAELSGRIQKSGVKELFDIDCLIQLLIDLYPPTIQSDDDRFLQDCIKKVISSLSRLDLKEQFLQMHIEEFKSFIIKLFKIAHMMKSDKFGTLIRTNRDVICEKIFQIGIPTFLGIVTSFSTKYPHDRGVREVSSALLDALSIKLKDPSVISSLPRDILKRLRDLATIIRANNVLRILKDVR